MDDHCIAIAIVEMPIFPAFLLKPSFLNTYEKTQNQNEFEKTDDHCIAIAIVEMPIFPAFLFFHGPAFWTHMHEYKCIYYRDERYYHIY